MSLQCQAITFAYVHFVSNESLIQELFTRHLETDTKLQSTFGLKIP